MKGCVGNVPEKRGNMHDIGNHAFGQRFHFVGHRWLGMKVLLAQKCTHPAAWEELPNCQKWVEVGSCQPFAALAGMNTKIYVVNIRRMF